jgi:hypothetical protein
MPDPTHYALSMIYVALTHAASLATGKPVDELADHLLREMLDENTPPAARDLLERITRDADAVHCPTPQ